jgi:XTP/dITP diphosphohydrolase
MTLKLNTHLANEGDMRIQIRFLSGNRFKIKEAEEILGPFGIDVVAIRHTIEELQTTDTEKLVRDKALKAFALTGRPLFVEHTGLYLEQLNGFPGGLTQVFWDTLQAERFSELFGNSSNTKVKAKTLIAFIDGKRYHIFEGEVSGKVSPMPRGCQDFQWDCVFIPDGYNETFAEMGATKNGISMRKLAFDKLANFLDSKRH